MTTFWNFFCFTNKKQDKKSAIKLVDHLIFTISYKLIYIDCRYQVDIWDKNKNQLRKNVGDKYSIKDMKGYM